MVSHTNNYYEDADSIFHYAQMAIENISGFIINEIDHESRTIYASTGVSGFSWGEEVIIIIRSTNTGSSITVKSNPKVFTNIFASGATRKNINVFFQEFHDISGLNPI